MESGACCCIINVRLRYGRRTSCVRQPRSPGVVHYHTACSTREPFPLDVVTCMALKCRICHSWPLLSSPHEAGDLNTWMYRFLCLCGQVEANARAFERAPESFFRRLVELLSIPQQGLPPENGLQPQEWLEYHGRVPPPGVAVDPEVILSDSFWCSIMYGGARILL